MLALPTTGFRRSVHAHNIDMEVCCDWMEACALFSDSEFTGSDVVDILRENDIYEDQSFAWEFVQDALNTIAERHRLMGNGFPVEVANSVRLVKHDDWVRYPAYSFCLILSLARAYPKWAHSFGKDYTIQGSLFEQLTAESLRASLSGWTVHPTGWSPTAPKKLGPLVKEIATLLGETTGDILRWTKQSAKEAGLDILCFRPFPDGRVGIPVYLLQCASGGDWESKLTTPDLRTWGKIISFAASPKRAFAMPFALSSSDFVMRCNVVNGLFLDRHRLLSPGRAARDWTSEPLSQKIVEWLTPRVAGLPNIDVG